jgi:hypothetical protein
VTPVPDPFETVSLVELKQTVKEVLPDDSPLRAAILAEPDTMPRAEAVVKVEVFTRLMREELRRW